MNTRDVWLRVGQKKLSRQWLDQHPEALQALLKKNPDTHVTCLCQGEPGIPLYIAKKHRYYLARMPGSGSRHAPYCPSYELPSVYSGFDGDQGKAIIESDDGTLSVNLAVAIGIASLSENAKLLSSSHSVPTPKPIGIHLLGLIHLLWERAGLNRWSPKMKGKRGYRTVFYGVRDAAETMIVKRSVLTNHLYVPEPFDRHRKAEIEAAQQTLITRLLTPSRGGHQRMLVLGQVKTFKASPFGVGIVIKHAPNLIFWLNQQRVAGLTATDLAGQDPVTCDCQNPLLWVMMSVTRSEAGQLLVADVALMRTHKRFIPVETSHDLLVTDSLIASDRHFIRPLRYEAPRSRVFPDFLLVDVDQTAVPLEIYGYSQDTLFEESKLKAIMTYKKKAVCHWHWDVSQTRQPPPFPPPDSLNAD